MSPDQKFMLSVGGAVEKKEKWDYEALSHLPEEDQIEDVSRCAAGVKGSGVRVRALLRESTPLSNADHVTFHSQDEIYAASIPLRGALENGILIYKRDGVPLPAAKGGPFRLVFPQGGSDCCNVKSVDRIELTIGKGKDTTSGDPDHDNPAIHGHSHDHSHHHDH
ncbi:MAG: molybdopterin-dependent oxidoreductase [Nitrospiria bacterium]